MAEIKCKVCGKGPNYSPVYPNAEEVWKKEMGWDENTSLCQRCLVERRNTALELVKASTDGPWEDASQLILEADRINRAILTIPASG